MEDRERLTLALGDRYRIERDIGGLLPESRSS